jgi:hypothetical protein
MGVSSVMSTVAAFLANALAVEGSIDDAIRYSRVSERHAADLDVLTQVMWRVARANATGDLTLAREAVELADPTDYTEIKAQALLALGDRDGAAREYERKGNVSAVRRIAAASHQSS